MLRKPFHLLTFIVFIFLSASSLTAQTTFWTDNFEAASLSNGVRTPSNNGGVGGPPFTSYFCRTPATSTVSQSVPFTGFQGSNYWAGEDHDAAGTGFPNAGTVNARQQNITWTNINISGRMGLSFVGSFAANSTNQPFDNRNACSGGATTNTDYLILQSSIDAGPWIDQLRFFTNGALTGKYLFLETTGDSCGDGTQLLNIFQDFTVPITGTGTTMSLRLLAYSEGGNEEWGIDNFRVRALSTLPVTWASFTAREQNNGVLLNWSTASEQHTKDFIVQHRTETGPWVDLFTLPAGGNSSSLLQYSYLHSSPAKGVNYYRIAQTDQDGKTNFSEVNPVRLASAQQLFTVTSNPAVNGVLQVQVRKPVTLFLYNAEGKLIWKKQAAPGLLSVPTSRYVKGVYSLRAENESRKVIIQ